MGIAIVYGTRPECIKVGPVVAELKALGITPQLISTGQHWDLLRGTPAETDLADSLSLALPSKSDPLRWVNVAVPAISDAICALNSMMNHLPTPPVVVVQGDTSSAFAGADAADELHVPLCHIEAGIRSGNLEEPWPEEGFRREITQLATWHYAPTQHCVDNLLKEGIPADRVILTGNPVVSALQRYAGAKPQVPTKHIILTMHRREWLQCTDVLHFVDDVGVWCLANPDYRVCWPVHPAVAPKIPLGPTYPPNLWMSTPLPYEPMIRLLENAWGLVTDSGGLVEEATTLGVPTAILRNANDRPEAVETGGAKQFNPENPGEALTWLVNNDRPRIPCDVYGTPASASHIAQHLASLSP